MCIQREKNSLWSADHVHPMWTKYILDTAHVRLLLYYSATKLLYEELHHFVQEQKQSFEINYKILTGSYRELEVDFEE